MDKIEAILSAAQFAVGIFGNPETLEFWVVDFPLPANTAPAVAATGKVFIGVAALVDGTPRTATLAALKQEAINALSPVIAERMSAAIFAKAKDIETVDWLEKLHSLPDPR